MALITCAHGFRPATVAPRARALAEEGGFARAARSQHLTQPVLTRGIQELELRTGIKLFDRNKARVAPTDLGRVFLARARELLGHAEALDREVATPRGPGGRGGGCCASVREFAARAGGGRHALARRRTLIGGRRSGLPSDTLIELELGCRLGVVIATVRSGSAQVPEWRTAGRDSD